MAHIDASAAGEVLPHAGSKSRRTFWLLTLGSIGVVYGDIGTSPLYALREAVVAAVGARRYANPRGGARRAVADPLGADHRRHLEIRRDPAARRQQGRGRHARADGAGAARCRQERRRTGAARHHQRCAVLRRRDDHAGACRCSPRSKASRSRRPRSIRMWCRSPWSILVALFAVQSRGTASVAAFFGPIMLVWFVAIAAAGLWHIAADPSVLASINPALRHSTSSVATA